MLLVDISMVMHRSFHAMDFLKTSAGVPSGMEFGTLRTIESLKRTFKQEPILCFDLFSRKDKGEHYKANRSEKPQEFYDRLNKLTFVLQSIYKHSYLAGHEADEILHGFTKNYPGPHTIYSNDSDLLQCISDNTVIIKSHNSEMFLWDTAKVFEKYLVKPHQFALLKALLGDKGDNIQGIKRLGKEYAAELVRAAYKIDLPPVQALKQMFEEANLTKAQRRYWEAFRDLLEENWKLVKLQDDLKPELMEPTGNDIQDFVKNLEIHSLEVCKETEF
jgi:DNA polymerase-1